MPTVKIKDRAQLKRLTKRYFDSCDSDSRPYTLSGLSSHLGMRRSTLLAYETNPKYQDIIDTCMGKIEAQTEENMLTGRSTSAPSQFILKNNFKWEDKVTVAQQGELSIKVVKELSTSALLEMMPAKGLRNVEKLSKAALQIEELVSLNNKEDNTTVNQ